jgi:heavy metal sensor kinase
MTIRTRLTLWYSGMLATVILIFSVSLFSLLNWAWREQQLDNMRQIAKVLLVQLSYVNGKLATQHIPTELSSMTYSPFGIQIWHADGELAAISDNLRSLRDFDRPADENGMQATTDTWREVTVHKLNLLVYSVPLFNTDNQRVGTIQLVASMEPMNEALSRLLRVMVAVGVVALLLSFMVGSVIAAQALQPIDTISHTAKAITAADDLSKRIPYNGPSDELGQLISTFNATLERLERLFLVQRRFVADVSHELRTPLTTIQGNLDLLKRFGADPVSLEAIETEVKRMTRLVGDLLLLAQADAGRLPLRETIVDLASLVAEVYNQTRMMATELHYKPTILEPVRVKGDADRLKQLVLNLVTNALKYTPAGGTVLISVTQHEGYAFISVKDTGIGIPKEDLLNIFDRFYRVDKARARQMGGFGLGLSIASWIVEAHKGRIWAESEIGVGSTFTVLLPVVDAEVPPESARATRARMPSLRLGRNGMATLPDNAPEKSAVHDAD